MARMIPKEPRTDTESFAELLLFKELEKRLSSKFTVFHSVAWQLRDVNGQVKDGETDFLIVHPEYGLLITEVKGGKIRYNSQSGQWFSNENSITDPFKQGRKAKYSLLQKLKENQHWANRWIEIGYSVAFPDVKISKDIGLDAPRQIIIDETNLLDLENHIKDIFNYLRSQENRGSTVFTDDELSLLERMLSPSWDFHPSVSSIIQKQERLIAQLTEDQFAIIDFLQHHRRVKIAGCAGSGKTLLGLEKAVRLQAEGYRTLFLCHNPFLANDLSLHMQQEAYPEILDFSTWVNRLSGKDSETNENWINLAEPTSDVLNRAFDKTLSSNEKYDAIIVDEGQDFKEEWWVVVEASLADDAGILYIFYDENQALIPNRSKIPIVDAPFVMSKNCRNTGQIFDLVKTFFSQSVETSILLEDLGIVECWELSQKKDFIILEKVIGKILNHLSSKRIAILTSETELASLQGRSIKILPKVRWQDAVNFHLKSLQTYKFDKSYRKFGYPSYSPTNEFPKLSNKKFPTDDDFSKIRRFVNSRVHLPRKSFDRLIRHSNPGKWEIHEGEYNIVGLKDARDVVAFFSSWNWADKIPPRQKYFLSTLSNINNAIDEKPIRVSSIESYKGLESDGVILFLRSPVSNFDKILYVGTSRAKHILYLLLGQDVIKNTKRKLGELGIQINR